MQKKEAKNIKSVQQWFPIKSIEDDGTIILKNNKIIKIIKIYPINYNLKSNLEKESILNSYKMFLKTCNFNIQILIQSNKEDLSQHIKNIQENSNKKINNIAEDYIQFINALNLKRKSSSKDFYIIISDKIEKNKINKEIIKNNLNDKYFKIKESLNRCGNYVEEIKGKQEIEELMKSFFNTRKNIESKFKKIGKE